MQMSRIVRVTGVCVCVCVCARACVCVFMCECVWHACVCANVHTYMSVCPRVFVSVLD